eukprot:gene22017-30573_t
MPYADLSEEDAVLHVAAGGLPSHPRGEAVSLCVDQVWIRISSALLRSDADARADPRDVVLLVRQLQETLGPAGLAESLPPQRRVSDETRMDIDGVVKTKQQFKALYGE